MNWFNGRLEVSTMHGIFVYHDLTFDRAQALLDYVGQELLIWALYHPSTCGMGTEEKS